MGRWQTRYGRATEDVGAEVNSALERARAQPETKDLVPGLEESAHDTMLVRTDRSRGVHNPWFAREILRTADDRARDAWTRLDPTHVAPPFALDPPFETKLPCATLCHLGIEEASISVPGTRFAHARHLGKAGDCGTCHSTAEHGQTLIGPDDCADCHHSPERVEETPCTTCHGELDRFLRGVEPGFDEPQQMMAKVACFECHGAVPAADVQTVAQENCLRCHGDKYEDALEEWLDYSTEWFEEAEDMLAPLREPARAKGGESLKALERADALLARLRRVRPAHNLLLFDELTGTFEEAVEDAER